MATTDWQNSVEAIQCIYTEITDKMRAKYVCNFRYISTVRSQILSWGGYKKTLKRYCVKEKILILTPCESQTVSK